MADFSFLDSFFHEKQENGPVFLFDLHREESREEPAGRRA